MNLFLLKTFHFPCLLLVSTILVAEPTALQLESAQKVEAHQNVGDIYLSVANLPAETTGLIVSIYRNQDNFLKKADDTFFFPIALVQNNELLLKNIPHGKFAISVSADLNANQLLDTKLFGIPSEPVGFANNAKSRFGPPRFKDHVVEHNSAEQRFDVSLVKI